MTTKEELLEQLHILFKQLNEQHAIIVQYEKAQGNNVFTARHRDGKWVLTEILAAKASTLNAIALLQGAS